MTNNTDTNIATFIRFIDGEQGHVSLYHLTPSLDGHAYVYVSATNAPYTGPETYIFPAPGPDIMKLEPTNWGELDGSYRGSLSHSTALSNAGYEVTEGVTNHD